MFSVVFLFFISGVSTLAFFNKASFIGEWARVSCKFTASRQIQYYCIYEANHRNYVITRRIIVHCEADHVVSCIDDLVQYNTRVTIQMVVSKYS